MKNVVLSFLCLSLLVSTIAFAKDLSAQEKAAVSEVLKVAEQTQGQCKSLAVVPLMTQQMGNALQYRVTISCSSATSVILAYFISVAQIQNGNFTIYRPGTPHLVR